MEILRLCFDPGQPILYQVYHLWSETPESGCSMGQPIRSDLLLESVLDLVRKWSERRRDHQRDKSILNKCHNLQGINLFFTKFAGQNIIN